MLRDTAFAAASPGFAPLGWRGVAGDDGFFFFGIVVGDECEVRGKTRSLYAWRDRKLRMVAKMGRPFFFVRWPLGLFAAPRST